MQGKSSTDWECTCAPVVNTALLDVLSDCILRLELLYQTRRRLSGRLSGQLRQRAATGLRSDSCACTYATRETVVPGQLHARLDLPDSTGETKRGTCATLPQRGQLTAVTTRRVESHEGAPRTICRTAEAE